MTRMQSSDETHEHFAQGFPRDLQGLTYFAFFFPLALHQLNAPDALSNGTTQTIGYPVNANQGQTN